MPTTSALLVTNQHVRLGSHCPVAAPHLFADRNHITTMNRTVLCLACALSLGYAFADESEGVTATTSTGTITEYTPGTTFVVQESTGPVIYRYSEKVTYVTKSGKTLTDDEVRARIKVGIPVNVQYSTEGKDRVISRVEVNDED